MRVAFWPSTVLLCCLTLSSGIPTLAQDRHYNNSQFYDGASRGVRGGTMAEAATTTVTNTNRIRAELGPAKQHSSVARQGLC